MAQLYIPSGGYVQKEPKIEVYINKQIQRKAKVSKIVESSGIEPATCILLFPKKDYLDHPCDDNDQVLVYINRFYYPYPFFRGRVVAFGDYLTLESGQYVEVIALDDVSFLNAHCVDRNYNILNTRDEKTEALSIRQIATDIELQMRSTIGSSVGLITYSFPYDNPGEVELLGIPYNVALEQLLEYAGEYKYYLRRQYTDNQTLIYAYKVGQGQILNVRRGTDISKMAQAQPYGAANIAEVRRENTYADIINAAVVLGDRKVLETALSLSKDWTTSKESMLSNIEAYTREGTPDQPNPDYDAEASIIGRRYRFGTVNESRFDEYPELEQRLLVAPPNDPTSTTDYDKPFVVYQYTGEGTYNVTYDINIADNIVTTNKPLVRDNVGGSAETTPELPAYVWLEAAYKQRSPLAVEIGKRGPANRTITRFFRNNEFKYKYQSAYFTISAVTSSNATLGSSMDRYYAAWNAGSNVIINDEATAEAWGIDRLKPTQEPRLEIGYDCQRLDLTIKVGMAVKENGDYLEASVFSVEHDLDQYKTTFMAVSR